MNAQTRIADLTIDSAVIAEAETLGVDVTRACEAALRAEIRRAADARWIEENRAGMEASNRWVEEHGLPLARYRPF